MDANSGGATPQDVAHMIRDLNDQTLNSAVFSRQAEHRHYFLRTREVEWEDGNGKVHTEYHYKCMCGERVIP